MEQSQCIGEWRCDKILGKGSFGIVGLWKNSKTNQWLAVKKFEIRSTTQQEQQQVSSDKALLQMQQRWKKEVELMYNVIKSPYVVSALPVPPELAASIPVGSGNLPLLCMEFCSGGDLRKVLKRPENICGLREKSVLTLLDHVSKAISHLHELNVIHRDLKPENILVHYDASNNVTTYKLTDLGLAKDLSNSQTLCSTLVGTPQYLAPEIYRENKYDKTVDYWSFGLIAFEVICGRRPFLHGESPTVWLPLVETKPKDVITIYRDDEGNAQFSDDIHYCTHLSERVKNCLVSWLRTMLQLDPGRRGKKLSDSLDASSSMLELRATPTPQPIDPNGPPPPNVGLKMLSKTLNARFLPIHTLTKVVEVPVGTRTKIVEVQERISEEIGLPLDNQLVFTIDGKEVQRVDLAVKFVDHADLYLIPRDANSLKFKLKLPKIVNNFLTQWESMKDPLKLELIWSCAIFFVQTELEKVETIKKVCDALKAWLTTNYTNQIKSLQQEIEKCASGIGQLLKLEKDLEEINSQYVKPSKVEETGCGVNFWSQEMSSLQNSYLAILAEWDPNLVLKPVRTSEIEEIYHKLLETCGVWKSSSSINTTFLYNENLVKTVCQFVVERNQVADAFLHNLKIQLEKVQSDTKLINELRGVGSKLEELSGAMIATRCAKHTALMKKVYGEPLMLNSSLQNGNKENASASLGAGGYATVKKNTAMSQSAFVVSPTSESAGPSKSPATLMAASVNSPLSRPSSAQMISLNQLKEESQLLKSKTAASIKSLRDSMEEMKEVTKIREGISWDFLEC